MRFIEVIKSRKGKPIDFEKIKPQIKKLCEKFSISLLYLFGSYATGKPHQLSDLDIAFLPSLEFDSDKNLAFLEELQDIFQEESIDFVDLSKAPLTLIHQVLKEGRCLYAQNLITKIEFESKKENLYYDTEPLRKEYFRAMIRRIKNGSFGYR